MHILRSPFALIYINSLLCANPSTFAFLHKSGISTLKFIGRERFLYDRVGNLYKGPQHRLHASLPTGSHYDVTSISDKIRNDSIVLKSQEQGDSKTYKKLLQECGKSYVHLANYSKELNLIFKKAAFIGATEFDSKEASLEVFGTIFHFRGYEYAESLCLVYSSKLFPLIPSPAANYIGATERELTYFEHILSGLSGLRVKRICCPYAFRNVLAIELVDTQSLVENVPMPTYELLIVCDRINKLILLDSESRTILATSECADEKEGLKFGLGKQFVLPEAKKVVPSKDDTFSLFNERFSKCQHMNLIKSMLNTYEGIDINFVQEIAKKVDIDPLTHVSKIENLKDFYDVFQSEVNRFTETANGDSINDTALIGSRENKLQPILESGTYIEKIYNFWGVFGPIYRHNRLVEECVSLIKQTVDRLKRIADQCENDPQQTERLEKVSERIKNIGYYENLVNTMLTFKKADHFEILTSTYNEINALGDLVNYAGTSRRNRKRELEEKEDRAKPEKKNIYKGILSLRVNRNEDSPLIIVGKNAKQNETVTHEIGKPGDLWLHVRDYPGGHILLRGYKNDENSIQMAADVASFISKGKHHNNVQVCVAKIENVKKYPGAEIGAVSVKEYRVVTGNPNRGMRLIELEKSRGRTKT